MNEQIAHILERFRAGLTAAATLDTDLRAGAETLGRAEAEALELIFAEILTRMPHIDHPVAASGRFGGPELDGWINTHLAENGIVLAGGMGKEPDGREDGGLYTGNDLVYTRAGELLERWFGGTWCDWQDGWANWDTGTVDAGAGSDPQGSTTAIGTERALEIYGLERIISGIDAEIERALEEKRRQCRLLEDSQLVAERVRAALKG